jgi:hypothetical protein
VTVRFDYFSDVLQDNFRVADNSPRIASPTWAAFELADWLSNLRC